MSKNEVLTSYVSVAFDMLMAVFIGYEIYTNYGLCGMALWITFNKGYLSISNAITEK